MPQGSYPPTSTTQNIPSGSTWAAGNLAGTLASQIMPGMLGNLGQAQDLEQQLALQQPEYQFQAGILGSNYGYQKQQFGVQQEELGLSQQELGQQQSHLTAQYGFQKQQDVLSGQDIQANIQNILQNYGYQQQGFGIQQGQLNLAHTQAQQGQAASGVGTSRGAVGQMEKGFGYQQQGLNLAERQARTQEQFGLGQQQRAQKQLGLTEAEQKEQYGYSSQQIQDGMKQLGLQQKNLGISEAQANTQYNNALQQLGLSNVMNVSQLKQQIAALAGGGYSPLSGMMGQLAQLLPFLGGMFTQPNK